MRKIKERAEAHSFMVAFIDLQTSLAILSRPNSYIIFPNAAIPTENAIPPINFFILSTPFIKWVVIYAKIKEKAHEGLNLS